LDIVAKGEVPRWDMDAKKFVSTSQLSEEMTLAKPPITNSLLDPQADETASEDLPF